MLYKQRQNRFYHHTLKALNLKEEREGKDANEEEWQEKLLKTWEPKMQQPSKGEWKHIKNKAREIPPYRPFWSASHNLAYPTIVGEIVDITAHLVRRLAHYAGLPTGFRVGLSVLSITHQSANRPAESFEGQLLCLGHHGRSIFRRMMMKDRAKSNITS